MMGADRAKLAETNNGGLTWTADYENLAGGALLGGILVGVSSSLAPTPEPGTWALMLAGFAGLGVALRSRRRQSCAA